jgi:hypothetical protein
MSDDELELVSTTGEGRKPISPFLTFAAIAALVVADYLVFRLLGGNYFRWYLDHGALLALGLSLVALAVDLDRDPTLIAAHPGSYAAGWFAVVGETSDYLVELIQSRAVGALDSIFTVIGVVVLAALAVAWIAVVAPLQYFVTLVTGALARSAAVSRRMWVKRSGKTIELYKVPADNVPEGMEEVGLAARPVTVTSTITAGVLYLVSLFV